MTAVRRIASLVVCGCLAWAAPAVADPVVDWNAIAVQVVGAGGRPGPSGVLDLAIVQVAVHDAVQAFDRRFKPYHVHIQSAAGSPVAAVASAAHDVLVARFAHLPGQVAIVDAAYHDYLASQGLAENDPGVFVGRHAAAGILALRAHDGGFPSPPPAPFIGGTAAGEWRPTLNYQPGPPASSGPMAASWLGVVEPFTKRFSEQFRAAPPPPLTSNRYARDYDEVRGLGARFNTARTTVTRTPEQTDLAYFWSDNPVAVWHRTLRGIALARGLNVGDSARLFALASMASADAIITAWDSKKHFDLWRPVTAVQEGDNDGNPSTAGDPDWQPLINTPPYPDYTSGANNLSGSFTRTLELFFGSDKFNFSMTSTFPLAVQKTRTFTRFSDAAADVLEVRIYQGIHFRFAETAGRRQGRLAANTAFKHFLRPVRDRHDGDDDDDDDDDDGDRGRDRRE